MRHVTLQSFQVMLRKKVVMKIRRKIEKLNNNMTNNVVSNGENASC